MADCLADILDCCIIIMVSKGIYYPTHAIGSQFIINSKWMVGSLSASSIYKLLLLYKIDFFRMIESS